MTLLEQIQQAAIDDESDLASILRMCKLLAARLDSKALESWLLWESNGYPPNVQLPKYRIWQIQVRRNFQGSRTYIRDAVIPQICIPKDYREVVTKFECYQSISGIEQALKEQRKVFRTPLGDLPVILGDNVIQGQHCIQAWGEFSAGNLFEVLNTVRNRVLDFALAIGKEMPQVGDSTPDSIIEPGKVTQIINTTVYGGAANLVGMAIGENVNVEVYGDDLASLEAHLEHLGVLSDDIKELKLALELEPVRPTSSSFGPKVSDWIGNMMRKAASGVWDVSVGAAGNLVAQAIAAYYGM